MSTPRPLMLATLGVLIVTVAQGCTFPQIIPQRAEAYGILKLDPNIDREEFRGRFGTVNTVANADGSPANADLSRTSITQLYQFEQNNLFAVASTGSIYNTNNGGVSWRQVNSVDGFNAQWLDYGRDDDTKIIVSGAQGGTGKIFLSTNESSLTQVYSDVPGGTSIPFAMVSKRNNNQLVAVVRNGAGDELITSNDGASSWQKYEKLPARVKQWRVENQQLTMLLENNQVRRQNNTNDAAPTFDVTNATTGLPSNQTINSVVRGANATFTLTNTGLFRASSEGTVIQISLPITDSPVLSFAVDPFNPSRYIAGVGTRLLETSNGGSSWTIRNDVGTDNGAGRILVTHFDPFVNGQIFLGRGQ